jgi:O-antigen/teichoic acid export membrane protein
LGLHLLKLQKELAGIKKLAGETLWYGVPTIATRFLSYALSLLAFKYGARETSGLTQVYAIIPFLNVLFTYGLETSYFRYTSIKDKKQVYNTLMVSLIVTTLAFTAILLWVKMPLAKAFKLEDEMSFITWMIWILFFDTLSVLPFAKLREEGRPRKYAFIKVLNIVINVAIVVFFTIVCESLYKSNPNSAWLKWYDPNLKVGYFILANLVASIFTLLFLYKEIFAFRWIFDKPLWKEIMKYSYPLVIVGFGGMINEMLSRLMYQHLVTIDPEKAKTNLGIFGACYKLAVLITIFIQIFKMAAEPFFFKKSGDADAKKTYARITKFFVIACCIMWLVVSLYLDVWKILITYKNKEYGEGIHIVPILAMASVFLGVYYNLSVWYKLTNKNMMAAFITFLGVVITIVLNFIFIPWLDYTGAAWTTLICYFFMMVVSYLQGQKQYPIPYATKKLIAYLVITVLLFFVHKLAIHFIGNTIFSLVFATFLLGAFIYFILRVEKREFERMPFIGKFVSKL